MAPRLKAFVSSGFRDDDRDINQFMLDLLKALGFDAELYDYQEAGRVVDKVKERIGEADCLIAIATRRTLIHGGDSWRVSDWVNQEVSFAKALNKPIAIFVEDGVKLGGFLETDERREVFSRDQLLKSVAKIVRFLFNLRGQIEQERQEAAPTLLRHDFRVRETVLSRELESLECEIVAEVLADTLASLRHASSLAALPPGLSLRPKEFKFVSKEVPADVVATHRIVHNTGLKFEWIVEFKPALTRGQRLRYAYKIVRDNLRPYTLEELQQRIKDGTHEYPEPLCAACDWTLVYPTSRFRFAMTFPDGYEISEPYVDVRRGEAELPAEGEKDRIVLEKSFTSEKLVDSWSLGLNVTRPVQDDRYVIWYVPPPAASLPLPAAGL